MIESQDGLAREEHGGRGGSSAPWPTGVGGAAPLCAQPIQESVDQSVDGASGVRIASLVSR